MAYAGLVIPDEVENTAPKYITSDPTIDPRVPDAHPLTLKDQSPEIILAILRFLPLCEQVCLALTCKTLATKIVDTNEHKERARLARATHLNCRPAHIRRRRTAPWHPPRTFSPPYDWMESLTCTMGECFWKNWALKKWVFDIQARRWRPRLYPTMEEDRLALVPKEKEPKRTGFIFAQLHKQYLKEDEEKEGSQDGRDQKRRRLG